MVLVVFWTLFSQNPKKKTFYEAMSNGIIFRAIYELPRNAEHKNQIFSLATRVR